MLLEKVVLANFAEEVYGLVWIEPWSCCLRKMTAWMLPVESSWFACSGYITDTLFGLKYLPGNLIFVNCEGI